MAVRPRPAGGGESGLSDRLKWMMLVRLALAGASLAAVYVLRTGTADSGEIELPPYITLTAACAINLAWLVLMRAGLGDRIVAGLQIGADVVAVGLLTYFLGPQSVFSYFSFAIVIGASAVAGSRAGFVAAGTTALSIIIVSALYHAAGPAGVLPGAEGALRTPFETQLNLLVARVLFFSLGLFALAYLSGRFSEEVRRIRIVNDEILQNMAGGVMAVDRSGAIVFVNPQALQLLGVKPPPGGLLGRPSAEVLPKEVAALVRRALVEEDRVERELRVGDTPVHIGLSRLTDGRHGVRGAVAIVNDLGLRVRVEQMSQRAERFRALLEMSAGMAHEIRNPLASIRGAAQELRGIDLSNEDDRRLLDVVVRESDRLDQIISDFLEYATDRPQRVALVDLPELLQETAVLLEARDEERRMEIRLELPRSLVCRGDADKLRQVFLNLGLNALDAVGAKGRLVIRALSARGTGDEAAEGALVEFEDSGPGIPPEVLPRVFDPFFTTKSRGTGMGLAIARKIIQAHEGTIGAESPPGKGASFRIWLPAA